MDFKLSKTHLLQQEMYRRFAVNEVKPLAEEMDETEVFDMELLKKMHKYGLMGIPYSKEYGGEGPVLYAKHLKSVDPPKDELVYFN
jgi:butyryl-CoA dehydrogenase